MTADQQGFHDVFHDVFGFTICFCVGMISPDLDGYRAPKMKHCPTKHGMFHGMLVY
jgi:hypothetical protein